ncbi:MAG TPA: 1-(5-phosphoribosyl)-5-[(5-phosphoribosylamino)methylideneamino] imidazole-4-carboxamide isomerase [Gemmatimonadales bacterium]|nr:1-(5-phosphoribosyl)-5-[(5-phosphoribosylamino)methylideneamino] imidazole-4-carboxamide isomerase [Gemmatimonadales bacterium]
MPAAVDILPAIDIRNGRAVRLSQGERGRETVYHGDPVQVAEQFADEGARWIHVVDLDRAFGDGDNRDAVSRLAEKVGHRLKLEVSGGIRTLAALKELISLPVARFVLGTAIVTDPGFVPEAVGLVGGDRLAAGLDARDGKLAIRGWVESTDTPIEEAARRVIEGGIRTIIHTDVSRDGMMTGPDLDGAVRLMALGARVIASGGVASLEDLQRIRHAGLSGAIVGRAIYEGRFTVRQAVASVS